jgi:predicted DNA-binding transcriptional regulator AlpA
MRILSFSELRPLKGISYSREHIRRLVNAREFPAPMKLGRRSNARLAWSEEEVDQWLADRLAERDKSDEAA